MKKTISIILSAVLLASSLFMTAYAGEAELSHEHLKLLMRAADTVCDLYATYDTGDYSDEIFYEVAGMFPETVEWSGDQPERVIASEAQVKAAVNAKWGYLSDKTLEEFFYSGLRFYCLKEDGKYELTRHPHGGGLATSFTAKGILLGYIVEDNGVCCLYYSTRYPKESANELYGSNADKFWEEAAKLGYPAEIYYNYCTFVEFQGDYYRLYQTSRVFEFKLTEDGLAEYVTDEACPYGVPISMTYVAGDINGDGEVDNKDVVTLFRFLSGANSLHINSFVVDTNGDGEDDNKDVVLLFRYCSGADVTLSAKPIIKG
ncbi:MAG: dockerin type I repeat-containing protein [Clostridia bacterium]|nr:dockerin type I repeat-containing protein [Clostridia bacterium]